MASVEDYRLSLALREIRHIFNGQRNLSPPEYIGSTDDHLLYEWTSPDRRLWLLHILKGNMGPSGCDFVRGNFILKYIKGLRPGLKAPTVLYITTDSMAQEQVLGQDLSRWEVGDRHGVLQELAEFFYNVWICPNPHKEEMSWKEWAKGVVDSRLEDIFRDRDRADAKRLLHMRHMISRLIPKNCPPHALTRLVADHGAMSPRHIIADEKGLIGWASNIPEPLVHADISFDSVIRWDSARWLPALCAIQFPLFMSGMPGLEGHTRMKCTTFGGANDRQYFQQAIRRLTNERGHIWIANLLETSTDRAFFLMALADRRVESAYIESVLANDSSIKTIDLVQQLGEFNDAHPDSQHLPRAIQLRDQLWYEQQVGGRPTFVK